MSHHHCHANHHHHSCSDQEDHNSCCCCHGHNECHENHHGSEQGDFAHQLLEMADEAWMEVLKDKIKHQIETSSGKHLDQLAKLVADSNHIRWKHKMQGYKVCDEYKESILKFFRE